MTRKLAVLIMLIVLAGTVAFLYYYTKNSPDTDGSSNISLFGFVSHTIDESRELDLIDLIGLDASGVSSEVVIKYEDVSVISAHFWGNVKVMKGSPIPKLSMEKVNGIAKIEVEPRGISSYRISQSDLQLEVIVPKSYEGYLVARSVSGSVYVEGAVNATSVDLDSVSGRVSVGDMVVRDSFKANSVSGSIETQHVTAGSFQANTVSGKIDALRVLGAGSINLESISGSINLGLPDGANFKIEASTVSGSIGCDFPLRIESSSSRKLVGTAGDGATSLKITTVSGSINVDSL